VSHAIDAHSQQTRNNSNSVLKKWHILHFFYGYICFQHVLPIAQDHEKSSHNKDTLQKPLDYSSHLHYEPPPHETSIPHFLKSDRHIVDNLEEVVEPTFHRS